MCPRGHHIIEATAHTSCPPTKSSSSTLRLALLPPYLCDAGLAYRTTTHKHKISRAELEVIETPSRTVWVSRRFPGMCQLRIFNRFEYVLSIAPLQQVLMPPSRCLLSTRVRARKLERQKSFIVISTDLCTRNRLRFCVDPQGVQQTF